MPAAVRPLVRLQVFVTQGGGLDLRREGHVYGERWCPGQWQALGPQGKNAGSCLTALAYSGEECGGQRPPHPLEVATLRGRSIGLSLWALCWRPCLPRRVLFPAPGSPGWVMLLKAIPWPTPGLCCSSSWEGPQYNRPGA